MKPIDPDELKRGDGADGEPVLVAVQGQVYDLSSSPMWQGGSHMNAHTAGADLTEAIARAPHGTDVLERYERVGELAPALPQAEPRQPPALIASLLAHHPHPVSVHFPIALSIVAAGFLAVGLVLSLPQLERAAFYNLLVATLAAPGAIGVGYLSWRYNYGKVQNSLFRTKLALSGVLMVVLASAVALRWVGGATGGTLSGWIYRGLVLSAAPLVMSLGFLGGRITFPKKPK